MTMEPPPSPELGSQQGAGPADQNGPQMRVLTQYVKELSFKNTAGSGFASAYDMQPIIDMGVEVKSRPMGDTGDIFEVDLRINVQAKREAEEMFSVDVIYSGIFQFLAVGEPDIEPMLWIECPRLLFPFSRQILAETTREGGYPPLLINPIDFTPLYFAELRDREVRAADGPGAPPAPETPPPQPSQPAPSAPTARAFSSNPEES